jgi:hypothetical protein
MGKKRLGLIELAAIVLSIFILLIPLTLAAIDIVISGNNVGITAIYVGQVTLNQTNITDSSNQAIYWWPSPDMYHPSNMIASTTYVAGTGNTTMRFRGSLYDDWRFVLPEGDYIFSIIARNQFGSIVSDRQGFKVDTTPCSNNNNVEPPEECDGTDLDNKDCTNYDISSPFYTGTLRCSDCHFNTSRCLVCQKDMCSICDDLVCSSDGRAWVSTTNYSAMCGSKDSNLGSYGLSCTSGECDFAANKWCDINNYWTTAGFCGNCTGKDSSCTGTCTPNSCDIGNKRFCDNGAWVQLAFADYCYVCKNFDSECGPAPYNYPCSAEGACDTKNNVFCQGGNWVDTNYCSRCASDDVDCGIPACVHGSCDTCSDAQKYCNNGVWESTNYCDANRCGMKDSNCNRGCTHGGCDTVNHKYCQYGLWSSDQTTYCTQCKAVDSSFFCLNPATCGNGLINWPEVCDPGRTGVPANMNGQNCTTMNPFLFISGNLRCSADCMSYDYSQCLRSNETCGNNVIDGYDDCEGTSNVGTMNCQKLSFDRGTLRCYADTCTFNTTGCINDAVCGDGSVDSPEVCEPFGTYGINGTSCANYDSTKYDGGIIGCKSGCTQLDLSQCVRTTRKFCGDKAWNQASEDCDDTDMGAFPTCQSLGYATGNLKCYPQLSALPCKYDTSGCVPGPETYCGDNEIQTRNSVGLEEQCEGNNLGGKECFDFIPYTGGPLFCTGGCLFDYTNCTGPNSSQCGDGVVNVFGVEDCDDPDMHGGTCELLGYDWGELLCYPPGSAGSATECKYNRINCGNGPRSCGDSKIQVPNDKYRNEQCDRTNKNDLQCSNFGYTGGYLNCKSDCSFDYNQCTGGNFVCGDGLRNQVSEDCDEDDLVGWTCQAFGYAGGTLRCNAAASANQCKFDKSGCYGGTKVCGDGLIQHPNTMFDEKCDDKTFENKTCPYPYIRGLYECRGDCTLDFSNCSTEPEPYCGDYKINKYGEECDRTALGGKNCSDWGLKGPLKCYLPSSAAPCAYDLSGCYAEVKACGDSTIQVPNDVFRNEQCDRTNRNSKDCLSFGGVYTGGILNCYTDCSFDYSDCTGAVAYCGDGLRNNLTEDCDEDDLAGWTCQALGYAGGTLSCNPGSCTFNKNGCYYNEGGRYCGDDLVSHPNDLKTFDELCDGSNVEDEDCPSPYTSGTLKCRGDCLRYDFSQCTSSGVQPTCGDGGINQNSEECDGLAMNGRGCDYYGFTSGNLKCNPKTSTQPCIFNSSACSNIPRYCSDSKVQVPNDAFRNEQCDKTNKSDMQCTDFDSYTGGDLNCFSSCVRDYRQCTGGTFECGDGVKNQISEDCDGFDLGGWTCEALGYSGGTLGCNECKFDKTGCVAAQGAKYCGDDKVNHPNDIMNEECDGTNVEGKPCPSATPNGYVSCHGECSLDYSTCTSGVLAKCGDNDVNRDAEECDGADMNGRDCDYFGYSGGTLKCTLSTSINPCKFDKSSCTNIPLVCSDGKVQSPNSGNIFEQCDKTNHSNSQCTNCQCANFDSYTGGTLGCDSFCRFDYNQCTGGTFECGDGIRNRLAEDCDKNDTAGWSCKSFGYASGELKCTNNCLFDKSSCVRASETWVCGDGIVSHPNSAGQDELCDGTNVEGKPCPYPYTGGALKCYGDCSFDYSSCTGGPNAKCGDNLKNKAGEDCDGTDKAGKNCKSLGFVSGDLGCYAAGTVNECRFDTSACVMTKKVCGDSIVQVPNDAGTNEKCDGANVGIHQCAEYDNYTQGTLLCSGYCTDFDYSSCRKAGEEPNGTCSDGSKGPYEVCDKSDWGGIKGCSNIPGYRSGNLSCKTNCQWDTTRCIANAVCGNSKVESGEVCDGTVSSAIKCSDVGSFLVNQGSLKCFAPGTDDECTFNKSSCVQNITLGRCGDNLMNAVSESCDGTAFSPYAKECSDFDGYTSGNLLCNNCNLNFSSCAAGNLSNHCMNNVTDGDETFLNCGGALCVGCMLGKRCLNNSDCISKYCNANLCDVSSCDDRITNGDESDIDCGWNCPTKCALDQACNVDADCQDNFCDVTTHKCSQSSCTDKVMNGGETDVDCGGPCSAKCIIGQNCISSNDCQSGYCNAGKCDTDRTVDTDGDGMPDYWELMFGLDPNRNDASEDMDGDGISNLEEYLRNTDPTQIDTPYKGEGVGTLQLILLIVGLILMIGSAGFLVYSRKVLLPKQRAAQRAARPFVPPTLGPGQKRPLQNLVSPGKGAPGQPGQPGQPGLLRRPGLASRLGRKPSPGRSLLRGFDKPKEAPPAAGAKPEAGAKPGAETKPIDEFIPLSELGKKPGPAKDKDASKPADDSDKPKNAPFDKLKEITDSYKKKKEDNK